MNWSNVETTCPRFDTAAQDSNPGSLSRVSEAVLEPLRTKAGKLLRGAVTGPTLNDLHCLAAVSVYKCQQEFPGKHSAIQKLPFLHLYPQVSRYKWLLIQPSELETVPFAMSKL